MISLTLALLYPVAIQYERGGYWKVLAPVTLLAVLLDFLANYTELAILTLDFPRKGEYLFSKRLERLVTYTNWRGQVARTIAAALDYFDPTGPHIIPNESK